MNSTLQIAFGLLGGLAIFLFGMTMMSECLQKAAGERMKKILALLTKNPVMGVLAGALTTAVLQSSSATTVMTIGFVSAGFMNLPQAISIILGANIGTTMTAQLLAFNISDYIFVIIFFGFLISFVAKKERIKNIGQTIFAFGLLFEGIEIMGSVMSPLATSPIFTEMIGKVSGIPILGVAVGTLMTLVVQSSSATIAVLQNFASQAGPDGVSSVIGLEGAIPILLGDNIGTTITAVLASIGQSKDAKRTAVAHCTFNVTGTFLFIWFIGPFADFIQMISPKGPEIEVISRQIANAHTSFNVVMTIIWTPLIWLLVEIVTRIIPDGEQPKAAVSDLHYLDTKLLGQPAAALQLVAKEVARCTSMVGDAVRTMSKAVKEEDKDVLKEVYENADNSHKLNEKITEYLTNLFSAGGLTEEQAAQTAEIMYVMSDLDRISLLCRDVADSVKEKTEKKYKYSKEAVKGLKSSLGIVEDMYFDAIKAMTSKDPESADLVHKAKDEITVLDSDLRKAHIERVRKGKCDSNLAVPFNKILHSIDRIGNSCVNIADGAWGGFEFMALPEKKKK